MRLYLPVVFAVKFAFQAKTPKKNPEEKIGNSWKISARGSAASVNERGISQSELSRLSGIPKSALSQYMSGLFRPKQDRTLALAKALSGGSSVAPRLRRSVGRGEKERLRDKKK